MSEAMDILTDTALVEELGGEIPPRLESPPQTKSADTEIPEKEADLILFSPASSETSKRKLEVTDQSDEIISPKRAKPSDEAQLEVLQPKKRVTRPKPKLTVPYSPNLRTSSRLRNIVVNATIREKLKAKANKPEKPIETQLSQHSKGLPDMYKSKTTLAVSPKLSTKARANARQTKQAGKSKKTK